VVLALSRVLSFCSALVVFAKAVGTAIPQSLFLCEDVPNKGVFA